MQLAPVQFTVPFEAVPAAKLVGLFVAASVIGLFAEFTATITDCPFATGFGEPLMVILTVAGALVPAELVAVKVKLSVPK